MTKKQREGEKEVTDMPKGRRECEQEREKCEGVVSEKKDKKYGRKDRKDRDKLKDKDRGEKKVSVVVQTD